jgi:hypothetical protein
MRVFTKTVELTKAQIDELDSTPIQVIAPASSGYAVIPVAAQIWKTAGAAPAIPANADIALAYENATSAIFTFTDVDGAGALFETAGSVQFGELNVTDAASAVGESVVIGASAAITSAVNTLVKVSVDFKIVKL